MAIQNFISTVWSESLCQALDKKYIAIAHCNRDFEGDILEKGATVKICGLTDINISDYTKNTNMNLPDTLSDYSRDLVIDQAKYFNFQIDDIDRAQSSPKLMDLAMKNAANALADAAERYVYGLHSTATHRITQPSLTSENVIDHLIDARTKLLSMGVSNPEDIVIEVSPIVAGLILKSKIQLATDNTAVLESGYLGSIGGCKIYVSNNIAQSDAGDMKVSKCFVRTKRAIAFAEQLSEIEAYRPELRFADAVKGLHLYGAKLVYPDELILLDVCVTNM